MNFIDRVKILYKAIIYEHCYINDVIFFQKRLNATDIEKINGAFDLLKKYDFDSYNNFKKYISAVVSVDSDDTFTMQPLGSYKMLLYTGGMLGKLDILYLASLFEKWVCFMSCTGEYKYRIQAAADGQINFLRRVNTDSAREMITYIEEFYNDHNYS